MSISKYLIDTNVLIGLEYPNEVPPAFAALLQLAATHEVGVYVHAAAVDDIKRDTNSARQRVTLSKIKKFQVLDRVIGLTTADLEKDFGRLSKPNDVVDATLLHALKMGVVDFVVSEDIGLHGRARRHGPGLGDRVLFVADAVSLLRSTFEPIAVALPHIAEVYAHSIPEKDPIFASLRDGYPSFDKWWKDSCVKGMRKCWVVLDGAEIAGLVVRKDESPPHTDAKSPGTKILKVCTFKVRPESRGVKLGELLLKQVLWFAQNNKYDVVYLTAYATQQTLRSLLEYYGFTTSYTKPDGELVLEKTLSASALQPDSGQSLFDAARLNYPRFYSGIDVLGFTVPIKQEYHEVLFPELAVQKQLDLFGETKRDPDTPGNTIRKVYLCRAKVRISQAGALLFFYKGKSSPGVSQALTTVGVFENMLQATSTENLRRLASGRSVYSDAQLNAFGASETRPVKVVNFLLAAHFDPPILLRELQLARVFSGHPPQSMATLSKPALRYVLGRLKLGFSL